MTISQALLNAGSGLAAASRRAAVTSNNIANAMTEGYHRRDVSLAERKTAGIGAGVDVAGITRAYNAAVTYERRGADASFSFDSANADAMAKVSDLLGTAEDANSLFQKYANFEAAMRALAETPDSSTLQQKVVSTAKELSNAFNRISEGYQKIRTDADAEIGSRVTQINDALDNIETLNSSIARGLVTGADVSALMDERQGLIDQVNESIPVREIIREDGKIDLMTPEGVFLLAGTARTIEFTPSGMVDASRQYLGGAGSLSGLTIDGKDVTPGGPGSPQIAGGAIAGLFNVRDNTVPEMALALDALAFDLASRFSDPAVDPSLSAGDPGLFTDNGAAPDVANLYGFAGRIEINASVDSAQGGAAWRIRDGINAATQGAAGSDTLVRSMISVMSQSRNANAALQSSGALSASEAAAHLTSLAAGTAEEASNAAGASGALAESLFEAEMEEIGVDTDRELQNLLLIEQAYAANARVLETVDRMIQRLMEI